MDYYKCEKCGKIFNEFDMDFRFAQEESVTLCQKCKEEYQCKVEMMKEFISNQPKKVGI